ncbi:hypothetical protein PGTUg99_003431 [Puccinia graminis f. sp. tritici]|uniref:Uncharacterized protein n=1 Tax=Puccinia graminis f. sp. tritici TaxID=56615 RepID=A0A5B0S4X3_PUCGR|nr:hypothetical protein PGTUg99_003431 [Puccinia graminis f. sp. tritici]
MNVGGPTNSSTPTHRRQANGGTTPVPGVTGGGVLRHTPTQNRYNPLHNYHRNSSGPLEYPSGPIPDEDHEGPNLGDYHDPDDYSELMQRGLNDPYAGGANPRGDLGDQTPPLPAPLELFDGPPAPSLDRGPRTTVQEDLLGQSTTDHHVGTDDRAPDGAQNGPPAPGESITPDLMRRYMETPEGMASMLGMLMQRGGANPIAAPLPGRHVYGPLIREYVRIEIRNIMKDHTMAAYTRTHALNGDMYVNTPLALIRTQVLAQPAAWRQTHLPIGLADNNNRDAELNLNQFLRTMVKHERTTLRNLLLIQVRPEPRVRPPGPIPKLFDLLVLINNGLTRRHHALPRDDLNRWATRGVRVRFAMLRLLAVNHYLNRPPGQTLSQWEIIDRHLEMLAGLSPVMIQAHIEIIIRKDAQLFDGIKSIGDIPRESITLPSDDEVAAEVARLNRAPAARQDHNPPAQ